MNRAQRRADAAREKMQRNADRIRDAVTSRQTAEQQLEWYRMLLFAVARREGRLLVRADDIAALHEEDRVDFVRRASGDVVVEYTGGASA